MMMTRDEAVRLPEGWAAAWNAHDLDRVLAHYSDDFEMTSPFIVKLMGEPSGTLKGKEQVAAYWRRALDGITDSHFDVVDVFAGVGSVVVYYKAVLGLLACEVFFDGQGQVGKAVAHYSDRLQQGATGQPDGALR
jgi:ketosteroid isomerase-like protein